MIYFINKKNTKQSIQNLYAFLKEKGFEIPRHIILDAFSKSIFYKNWNTLDGVTSKSQIIKHFPNKKIYMIEIECDLNKDELVNLVKNSFLIGNCEYLIENVLFDEKSFHIEISFPQKTDNFLTSMFVLAESLKKHSVTRFDLLRIIYEKESILAATK